jgi:DNA processing protein
MIRPGRMTRAGRGFSLLELLVAVAIIATLVGTMSGFLIDVLRTRDELERLGSRERAAGVLLDTLERDLQVVMATGPGGQRGVRGDASVLGRPAVAIVGARNASALGLRTARVLARGIGLAGRVVVSGLARGIDAAAHEAALETGTVAVLPGGLDRIYPEENAALAARIAERGALVTECAIGVEPTARHFPKRNRLIAGLAQGVVLIEAASRSGSLITARYALDQGREVMACPGSPEDPRSAGCNMLIRDGAALIRNAEDVLEALAMPRQPGFADEGAGFVFDADIFEDDADDTYDALADFDPDGRDTDAALSDQVIRLLGPNPVEIDEIARACGARPAELSLIVLELELAGRIEVLAGGRIALAPEEG